jgi:hypothetical protein
MPFLAGYIYPLIDADHFDDDLGTGYDHIMIPHDATPGECYIHDAWIVNSDGEVHPGYNANPHPFRLDSVEIEKGRPLDAELPSPKSIFDSSFAGR